MKIASDISGQIFGRLTAVRFAGKKGGLHVWECVCECGNRKVVYKNNLTRGISKSCGCLRDGQLVTHGLRYHPLYKTWRGIKNRCNNPNATAYKNYGGRGITICAEWDSFKTFLEDMGDPPFKGAHIDRIDNNKGYSKENCRWVTPKQNARNMRTNRLLNVNGEVKTLAEWSEIYKLSATAISVRISKGMSETAAVTTPMMYNKVNGKGTKCHLTAHSSKYEVIA